MSHSRSHFSLPAVVVAGSLVALTIAALIGIAIWGASQNGGSSVSSTPTIVTTSDVAVAITDFKFVPSNVSVPLGASLTWTNEDTAPHDATDDSESWATGTLEHNDGATIDFDQLGTFEYYCSIHPRMRGIVIVRATD